MRSGTRSGFGEQMLKNPDSLSDAQAEAVTARAGELPGFLYGMLLPGFLAHIGLLTLLVGLVVGWIALHVLRMPDAGWRAGLTAPPPSHA